MNKELKARWANILSATVAILVTIQGTFLTNPPFSEHAIFIIGTVATYLVLVLTGFKQYLSPDVNDTGLKVTIFAAVIATVAGFANLINIFTLPEHTVQLIKWSISIIVMILNLLSKQIFPSFLEKTKMARLKND